MPMRLASSTQTITGAGERWCPRPLLHSPSFHDNSHCEVCLLCVNFQFTYSWKLGGHIDVLGGNECTATQLPNGTLLMSFRVQGQSSGCRHLATSLDGGLTWGEAFEPVSANDPSTCGVLDPGAKHHEVVGQEALSRRTNHSQLCEPIRYHIPHAC